MASADFSTFSRTSLYGLKLPCIHGFIHTVEISPDKSDNFHPRRLVHLHHKVRAVLDFALLCKLVRPCKCLICTFCSSGREFAADFLQIPPRGGHPCLKLTVPTAKSVTDFHRQVIAHAGRTQKKLLQPFPDYRSLILKMGETKESPLFHPVLGDALCDNCASESPSGSLPSTMAVTMAGSRLFRLMIREA